MTGCSGQIFTKEQQQAGFAMSGLNLNEPARLWKNFPDIDQVILKDGADAITYSEIGEGRFRATFPHYKPFMAEVDVDRSAGFHMTAFRLLNADRKEASPTSRNAIWRHVNDAWYVNEYVLEYDTRGRAAKSEHFSRSVFKYDSFDVNVKVEPDLFTLNSFAIPAGTQFNDRRQKGVVEVRYWNGTALQAERP